MNQFPIWIRILQKNISWLDELQQKRSMTIVAIEHRLDLWGDFFDREIQLEQTKSANQCIKGSAANKNQRSLDVNKVQYKIISERSLFHVDKGEVAVLAGPNGSGKSTLLKALCQLIPTNGTVQPSHLGYVPQSPEFLFRDENCSR